MTCPGNADIAEKFQQGLANGWEEPMPRNFGVQLKPCMAQPMYCGVQPRCCGVQPRYCVVQPSCCCVQPSCCCVQPSYCGSSPGTAESNPSILSGQLEYCGVQPVVQPQCAVGPSLGTAGSGQGAVGSSPGFF